MLTSFTLSKTRAIILLVSSRSVTIDCLECTTRELMSTTKKLLCRVWASTVRALGMGVNFVGLCTTIHYGAPCSLDDYFQESGRAGRNGEASTSTIYWMPIDAPRSSQTIPDHRQVEATAVSSTCWSCCSILWQRTW